MDERFLSRNREVCRKASGRCPSTTGPSRPCSLAEPPVPPSFRRTDDGSRIVKMTRLVSRYISSRFRLQARCDEEPKTEGRSPCGRGTGANCSIGVALPLLVPERPRLMVVGRTTEGPPRWTNERVLPMQGFREVFAPNRNYDITPDGKRFLIIVPAGPAGPREPPQTKSTSSSIGTRS